MARRACGVPRRDDYKMLAAPSRRRSDGFGTATSLAREKPSVTHYSRLSEPRDEQCRSKRRLHSRVSGHPYRLSIAPISVAQIDCSTSWSSPTGRPTLHRKRREMSSDLRCQLTISGRCTHRPPVGTFQVERETGGKATFRYKSGSMSGL